MPGGKTIAHGLLSLSLTPMFIHSVMGLKGLKDTLNYGADRIRYLTPVPAGSKLRGRVGIAEAEDAPRNGLRVHYRVVIQIEGGLLALADEDGRKAIVRAAVATSSPNRVRPRSHLSSSATTRVRASARW